MPVGAVRRRSTRRRRPIAGRRVPGDPQDGAAGLRRQGPAHRRPTRPAMRAAWRLLAVGAVRARAGARARDRAERGRGPHGRRAASPPSRSPRTLTSTGSSTSPSCRPRVGRTTADRAIGLAMAIADALDYVGRARCRDVRGRRRPGASTSWRRGRTTAATGHSTRPQTSQFAQQIRAVCGVGVGRHLDDLSRRRRWPTCSAICGRPASPTGSGALELPGVALHLYGKAGARPGRKMGHLTAWADRRTEAAVVARQTRQLLSRD